MKPYEMGRLSTSAATESARVSKLLFLTKLADYSVATFDTSEEEIQRDLASSQCRL